MIFGEDFGQLAASGEYEIYKSGTTIAQLKEAIDGLSIEEYLDSFLTVADNSYFATEGTILYPFNTTIKIYLSNTLHDNETNRTSITTYYYSGTILEVDKKISGSSVARTVKRTNDGTLSISHWTLYRRQKSYDVAISGSKVASAIAPVQNSLATANRNYSVGQQFYYDGHLYKVISAITPGAQIVLGTNAVVTDDVTTQMKVKVLAESGSAKKYSLQLADLEAAYNSLSFYDRCRSAIIENDNYSYHSINPSDGLGRYCGIMINYTNSAFGQSAVNLSIKNKTYYQADTTTSGTTFTNYSENVDSGKLKLVLL